MLNLICIRIDFDLNGKVQFANNNFLDLIGYDEKEIINYSIFELLSEEDKIELVDKWDEISKGKNEIESRCLLSKNYFEKWLKGAFFPFHNLDSAVSKIVF